MFRSLKAVAVTGLMSLLFVSMSAAQNRRNTADLEKKPTPRAADGHPDLNGYWVGAVAGITDAAPGEQLTTRSSDGSVFFDYAGAQGGGYGQNSGGEPKEVAGQPSYKPEYQAKVDAIAKTMYGGTSDLDPYMECKPLGVPRATIERPIMQVAVTPTTIIIAHEAAPGPAYRVIYTDGRPHPKDIDSSYFGHSIGHWEGDTLVVDTIGLNDETWLADTRGGHAMSTIHSDKEHVIERWTRKGDVLLYDATVEDPVMFTKPWVVPTQHIALGTNPNDYIQPSMCIPLDKGHLITPTEKDQFKCNWCNPETTYDDTTKPADKAAGK